MDPLPCLTGAALYWTWALGWGIVCLSAAGGESAARSLGSAAVATAVVEKEEEVGLRRPGIQILQSLSFSTLPRFLWLMSGHASCLSEHPPTT